MGIMKLQTPAIKIAHRSLEKNAVCVQQWDVGNIGWDDDDDVINNGTNVPEKSFPESQTVYQNPSFRISTEIDQAVTKGESLQNNSEKGN